MTERKSPLIGKGDQQPGIKFARDVGGVIECEAEELFA